MYRVNEKQEAIRAVQTYLALVGNQNIFVAPTGVFDDNTRLSVIDFQDARGIDPTGIVDYETFTQIYSDYVSRINVEDVINRTESFIVFPLIPGSNSNGMIHINQVMKRVLDYYGIHHNLRINGFYSQNTKEAVSTLRKIYQLEESDIIDEIFYQRLINDHNSISKINNL